MPRWAKAMLSITAGALLLAAGAGGALWWVGSRQLAKDHGALPETVVGGPGNAALGARLVKVYGCGGCHGESLAGEDFYGMPAPNLRRRHAKYKRRCRFLRRDYCCSADQ